MPSETSRKAATAVLSTSSVPQQQQQQWQHILPPLLRPRWFLPFVVTCGVFLLVYTGLSAFCIYQTFFAAESPPPYVPILMYWLTEFGQHLLGAFIAWNLFVHVAIEWKQGNHLDAYVVGSFTLLFLLPGFIRQYSAATIDQWVGDAHATRLADSCLTEAFFVIWFVYSLQAQIRRGQHLVHLLLTTLFAILFGMLVYLRVLEFQSANTLVK